MRSAWFKSVKKQCVCNLQITRCRHACPHTGFLGCARAPPVAPKVLGLHSALHSALHSWKLHWLGIICPESGISRYPLFYVGCVDCHSILGCARLGCERGWKMLLLLACELDSPCLGEGEEHQLRTVNSRSEKLRAGNYMYTSRSFRAGPQVACEPGFDRSVV